MIKLQIFLKRAFILSLCLLVLSGCTTNSTKFAYKFLGIYIRWEVKKYVTLDDHQKVYLKKATREFHDWHRRTQLEVYASYIDAFIALLESGPITAETLHNESDKVQVFLVDAMEKLLPTITELASGLSDEQTEEVLKELAKERKKFNKKFIKAKRTKVLKRHQDSLLDNLKRFFVFSEFTPQQQQLVDDWATKLVPYEPYSLEQQEFAAQVLQKAFEMRDNKPAFEKTLRALLAPSNDNWNENYREATDINQTLSFQLIADLLNSQTDKQRKKTLKKLNKFKKDFLDLASSKLEETNDEELVRAF